MSGEFDVKPAKTQFSLRGLLLFVAVAACLFGIARAMYDPRPRVVRIFSHESESFKRYVQAIKEGGATEDDFRSLAAHFDSSYALLPEYLHSVRRKKDGCIHFLFFKSPVDSMPVLIYAPLAKATPQQLDLAGYQIFDFRQLEPHWYYCTIDSL